MKQKSGPEPWEIDRKGHVWDCNEDGTVDITSYLEGTHNGPVCVVCGYSFCHHCRKEVEYPCPGN